MPSASRHIHIIVFDIPYPATYGGAIDVFYRIRALSELGVQITLHCFYKGELTHYPQLESLCREVYYYPRKTSWRQMLKVRPYAVTSRTTPDLLQRLLQDADPILFEGLVSCALIDHPLLGGRKKYLRECNIEHDYFRSLGKVARTAANKFYYFADALKLRLYERKVRHATAVFSIAHQDEEHFRTHYPEVPVIYLPASHPDDQVKVPEGLGKYILYHGNLDVSENYDAARLIAQHVAAQMPETPFVIAGRYHNHALDHLAAKYPNVRLVTNPDSTQMRKLITDAQIHLLLTRQATGLKLKLLNVLYNGRHVVVNDKMVIGTELAPLCHVVDKTNVADVCRQCMTVPVTKAEQTQRAQYLAQHYDNQQLGQTLLSNLF